MKLCTKCKIEKDESEFYRDKNKKGGLSCWCKSCQKQNKEDNKERNRLYQKQYDLKRRESRLKHPKEYYEDYSSENKKYCIRCKEIKDFNCFYKDKNGKHGLSSICINCQKIYDALRYATPKRKEYSKRKHQEFKEVYNKTKVIRYNTDLSYRLSCVFSVNIYSALKKNKCGRHWEDLVPYTLQELKEHLESQFTPEMSWGNYGEYWEVDHIIPQNTFSFVTYTDKDFQICWSLANLRPLEKSLNRSRPKDGSDIPEGIKQSILNQTIA